MLADSDAAWLSGFIDGEGYVGIHPQRRPGSTYYQANVFIRNTHRLTMEHVVMLLSKLEIAVALNQEDRGERHKDSYRANVTGFDRMLRLADAVEPFTVTKVMQWQIVREWCEARRNAKPKTGYSPEDLAIARIGIAMNRRGKTLVESGT